jgi:hypothetical protein
MPGKWFSDAEIAPCLDHQPMPKASRCQAITGRHYNHAQRKNMEAKRRVLDRWAVELQRIIGEPLEAMAADIVMRLAA